MTLLGAPCCPFTPQSCFPWEAPVTQHANTNPLCDITPSWGMTCQPLEEEQINQQDPSASLGWGLDFFFLITKCWERNVSINTEILFFNWNIMIWAHREGAGDPLFPSQPSLDNSPMCCWVVSLGDRKQTHKHMA